ncbi:radical SAM protein [Bordetella sp. 15P40C-2]|uniref:radical SAM protein n=1 Tax=Bordetella sp. 15P40C-2 TaxID=2572246 RepID=UPI0013652EB5
MAALAEEGTEVRHVEIILKVAERCNLNCTYCYFFNKENRDYENNPALISIETIKKTVLFLRSAGDLSDTVFQIDIHGGEPLLLGPKRFAEMVGTIKEGLREAREVNFTVQTNAVLLNRTWIDVLAQHRVHVGISVDGPKKKHDENRIDRRGRGTYDRMVPNIHAVRDAVAHGTLPSFGAICVLSPDTDARATYDCLTHELGFSRIRFLFPDDTHDSVNREDLDQYARIAGELFDCWEKDDRKIVRVQIFNQALQALLAREDESHEAVDTFLSSSGMAFTISSSGDLGHDDTLRNVVPALFRSGMNVADVGFSEFCDWYNRTNVALAPRAPVATCASCPWSKVCRQVTKADTALHWMKNGIVDSPSIYCSALKTIYMKSAEYLVKRAISVAEVSRNLNSSSSKQNHDAL